MNAIMERRVGNVRREILDRILIVNAAGSSGRGEPASRLTGSGVVTAALSLLPHENDRTSEDYAERPKVTEGGQSVIGRGYATPN